MNNRIPVYKRLTTGIDVAQRRVACHLEQRIKSWSPKKVKGCLVVFILTGFGSSAYLLWRAFQ